MKTKSKAKTPAPKKAPAKVPAAKKPVHLSAAQKHHAAADEHSKNDARFHFMQEHGVEVTWNKEFTNDANTPEKTIATVNYGGYGIRPAGQPVSNESLQSAVDGLIEQYNAGVKQAAAQPVVPPTK